MSKVCIIGLDGGTWRIIDYLISKNRLTHFARTMGEGSRAKLMSTRPSLTPPAWVSFYTGVNPGRHGVVDFFHRDSESYKLAPVNARTVKAASIWSLASSQGKRVCVYNVPVTYPAEPVDGILISGMDAPRFDSQAIYPGEYRETLLAAIPEFTIETPLNARNLVNTHPDPVGECIRNYENYLDLQTKVVRHLMEREDWDLFTAVIRSPDVYQHVFWGDVEKVMERPEQASASELRKAESVFSCYEKIDHELGEVWSKWGSDRNLVVMSDHGFGLLHREVCVNRVLADAGLLKFRQKSLGKRSKEFLFGQISNRMPEKMQHKITRKLHGEEGLILIDRLVADVDWSKTRLYSVGPHGCMYVNLAGREPMGIVKGEEERQAVLAEAQAALSAIKDPRDNKVVFTELHRREDIYSGPYVAEMPDMVTVMRNNSYRGISNTRVELSEKPIFRSPLPEMKELAWTGCHRREGMLLMHGPDIAHSDLGSAEMVDIAPTVMEMMGLPAHNDWDGAPLEHAFKKARGARQPADGQIYERQRCDQDTGSVYSEEDEDEVRKRLQDLGYI